MDTHEEVVDGLVEYRLILNEYIRSLEFKEPRQYLDRNTVTGENNLPKDLLAKFNLILQGKTLDAQQELQNRFRVLNEAHRQDIERRQTEGRIGSAASKFDELVEQCLLSRPVSPSSTHRN